MTKTQVVNKVNKLMAQSQKKLEKDINDILLEADMWYGSDSELIAKAIAKNRNKKDRNGDQFAFDGPIYNIKDASLWLHTRKELGLK